MTEEWDGVGPNKFAPEPVVSDIGAIPDREYAPFSFIPGDDKLIFQFSTDEFVKVLSALRNGAMMTYGENGPAVYWSFLRNVDYPIMICASIIDCITNDADTQSAFADYLANNPLAQQAIQSLIDNGTVVPSPTTAITTSSDLDALFGACTFLVDTMNGLNEDLYQAIEASSNKREQGALVFRAIPILNELPFDEASEYIDNLIADVAENYDAEYTTTPLTGMRDKLRCAIFCMARDNGNSLSWENIANYFWGKVGYSSDYVRAFRDFLTFFNSGSWPGDQIVYISFANIASVLSSASKFAEMTLPSLGSLMNLGLNDPDSDWMTLCEDCPPEPTPRWQIYWIGTFEGQVPVYNGPDPDYPDYDRWTIPALDYTGGKYVYLGTTYNYGVNFKLAIGTDYLDHLFDAQAITGYETTYTYTTVGFVANSQLPDESGPGQGVSEMFTNTLQDCVFRIKPRV